MERMENKGHYFPEVLILGLFWYVNGFMIVDNDVAINS